MKALTFSYNWNNKLDCKCFTTIRLHINKYQVGDQVCIMLKGAPIKEGRIVGAKVFYLRDLNDFMAMIDTGYTAEQTREIIKKMYPGKDFQIQPLVMFLVEATEKK